MAELLFWPALLAYGEAAVAYLGVLRRPELATRLAIWGVRVGWLAQTALLVAQGVAAEGFAWTSWAGALNLLAWLVVGAYLIWGCSPRFRLLGLAVMPVAAALLVAAYAGGGTGEGGDRAGILLALHVALILGAFAGFTLAAALSALYLWHDHRLKRRAPSLLRVRVPPLLTLERLAARTIAVSFAALTAGMLLGFASLARDGGRVDAAMAATLAAWLVYAAFLVVRRSGARAAYLSLAGFVAVAAVLSVTHFA